MEGPLPRFWSDQFDSDLLVLFPELQSWLGEWAFQPVWTLGHCTFGRLNHPCVWNTHGAYLWTKEPLLVRDKDGWANVLGCVSDSDLVACIWIEWLRDCWAHHFNFVVLPMRRSFVAPDLQDFNALMYSVRGWELAAKPVELARSAARRWAICSTVRLARCVELDSGATL